jgi:hypothetical protein
MMDFTVGLPNKHEGSHKSGNTPRRNNGRGMLIALIATSIAAAVSTTAAIVFYVKYEDLNNNPNVTAQNTKQEIVDRISKLYDAPNEDPTLAQVENPEKLSKEQEFFRNAKAGDYIVVYPKAKLGILYRESTNKIINIGPVSTQAPTDGTSSNADETQDQ